MIDIHTHLHPEPLFRAIRRWFAENSPWKLHHPTSPELVAKYLKEQGVERFVFCSYAHKPGIARDLNTWLLNTSKELHGYGLPLLTVHLDDLDYAEYAKSALAGGAIGMKIHEDVQGLLIDDPRFRYVYSAIEEMGGYVLAHVGPIPWKKVPKEGLARVRRVMETNPNLKFVVAHMGSPDTHDYLPLLKEYKSLYLDTTMCYCETTAGGTGLRGEELEQYADKILFGSDWPNVPHDYASEPNEIKDQGISDRALRLIMHDNAAKLLANFL
jgi:uncharacterized protein